MYLWMILGIGALTTIIFLSLRVSKGGFWGLFSKAAASLLFVTVGVAALCANPDMLKFAAFMIVGLVCGLLGDVWLDLKWIYPKEKDIFLIAGFISFMLGHIAFISAEHSITDLSIPQNLLAVLLALIIAGVALLLEKPMHLQYGKFKGIVFCYTFLLSLTMTTAIVLAIYTHFATRWLMFAIGGLLFLLSDLVLSGMYFAEGKNTKGNILCNHILYYLAQFTLACSIYFMQ